MIATPDIVIAMPRHQWEMIYFAALSEYAGKVDDNLDLYRAIDALCRRLWPTDDETEEG